MIERQLTTVLKERAKKMPIVAVLGPRQAGKTTAVKDAFPDKPYVSLEDLENRAFAESDPKSFLEKYSGGGVIDEIQRVPSLFSYLQGKVDQTDRPGQFIITGSQHFLLLQQITQSLAGRVALLKLYPLSISELIKSHHEPKNCDELMFRGGYPRLYKNDIQPSEWHPDYLQTYIERDVRQIKNISDLSTFQKFLKLCAGRIGQLLNLSSLATECGITHNTAKSWISVLEASFVIVLLQPYHRNFNKRVVKMPKLYFVDTGVACSLLDIKSAQQLESHYVRGNLFENLMVMELMKSPSHQGRAASYYFWRDKNGHEIDLLLDQGGKVFPIEIKSGKTINAEFFSGLEYWKQIVEESAPGTLIYGGDQEQDRQGGRVVNWRTDPGEYLK